MENSAKVGKLITSDDQIQLDVELETGFGVSARFIPGTEPGTYLVTSVYIRDPNPYKRDPGVIPARHAIERLVEGVEREHQDVDETNTHGQLPHGSLSALNDAIVAFAGAEGHAFGNALRDIRGKLRNGEFSTTFVPATISYCSYGDLDSPRTTLNIPTATTRVVDVGPSFDW